MKKQLFKALCLVMSISLLCSCGTPEDANTSANETSNIPESSFSESVGNEETSIDETPIVSETPAPETSSTPETEITTTTTVPAETPAPETEIIETLPPEPPEEEYLEPVETESVVTTPVAEWTEAETSGTKYVNTACYSRKKAVLGAEKVKLYNVNDEVTVVAKTDTSYYKLEDGSFIHTDYLSDNKVDTTPNENQIPQKDYGYTEDGHKILFYNGDGDPVIGFIPGTTIGFTAENDEMWILGWNPDGRPCGVPKKIVTGDLDQKVEWES